MEKKQTTVLTRVAFCEKCFKNKMPQKGQLFLTIGRGRQRYGVRTVTRDGTLGFTPHIIEKDSSTASHVTFHSYCGMNGCGCILKENDKTGQFDIAVTGEVTKTLPTREWNAMIKFKDDPSYWLD